MPPLRVANKLGCTLLQLPALVLQYIAWVKKKHYENKHKLTQAEPNGGNLCLRRIVDWAREERVSRTSLSMSSTLPNYNDDNPDMIVTVRNLFHIQVV